MRVAALYDIHANLPALEAVLQEVRRAGVDEIVIGGDVFPGPMPRESLARLRALDRPVRWIQGNGDCDVLSQMRGVEAARVPAPYRGAIRWVAQQLNAADEGLAGWPATCRLEIDGVGAVLFCHATPVSDNQIFTRLTPEDRLVPWFSGIDADLVVCGHTHMPFDRTIGGVRVVNAGSVGMPFGPPGADWLLLGPGVEWRHTDYDREAAATRVRQTGYPGAEQFASGHILQPPTEQQMLEVFEQA